MLVNGYIHIDGQKLRVSAINRARTHDVAVERRPAGEDGIFLTDVQAFLDLPQHKWLRDPLCYGVTVYLPITLSW